MKFLHARLKLKFGEHSEMVDGQLSEVGATRVFLQHQIPTEFRAAIGQVLTVMYNGRSFNGVLIQQTSDHEKYYDVRFLHLLEEEREFLRKDIDTYGVEPGWSRKFPRIELPPLHDEYFMPTLCSLRYDGEEYFLTILNFTLGGIRVETIAGAIPKIKIGQYVRFDLLLSNGELLRDFDAEVRNMANQSRKDDDELHPVQSLGLRITKCSKTVDKKYKTMIRDYCVYLKKIMVDEQYRIEDEQE